MSHETAFLRVGIDTARALIARAEVLVLDVRDAASYERARIGSALHVSDADLRALFAGTPKDRAILIYCYHGRASQAYAQMFADFGFREVYSLDGGFEGWRQTFDNSPGALEGGPSPHE